MFYRTWIIALSFATLLLATGNAWAADVAKLLFAQGMVTVRNATGAVRVVAKGSALAEGDTVATAPQGFAVVEYTDGAKITLRPDSTLTINQYNQNAVVHTLVKGGLRSVTGAIGKANPAAVKYQAGTATLGIRGTTFDARLCQNAGECDIDKGGVIARVIFSKGDVQASGRVLAKGAGIAAGDVVTTGAASVAVLAFVDGSKVSLAPGSSFSVKNWLYKQGDAGKAMLQLIKGAVRVATGSIGKSNPAGYQVQVATAVIGVRGTGFDLDCHAECADTLKLEERPASEAQADGNVLPVRQGNRLYAYVWEGAIDITTGKFSQLVSQGQMLAVEVNTGRSQFLPRPPVFMPGEEVPRPDQTPGTFNDTQDLPPGLYAWVRSGLVTLEQGGSTVLITPGESAFAHMNGLPPITLPRVPAPLVDDQTPYPETFDQLTTILQMRSQLRSSFITPPAQCTIR